MPRPRFPFPRYGRATTRGVPYRTKLPSAMFHRPVLLAGRKLLELPRLIAPCAGPPGAPGGDLPAIAKQFRLPHAGRIGVATCDSPHSPWPGTTPASTAARVAVQRDLDAGPHRLMGRCDETDEGPSWSWSCPFPASSVISDPEELVMPGRRVVDRPDTASDRATASGRMGAPRRAAALPRQRGRDSLARHRRALRRGAPSRDRRRHRCGRARHHHPRLHQARQEALHR